MISNVSEIRGGGPRDAVHALTADAGSSEKTKAVVPREALEIVGVGAEVGVGNKKKDGQTTNSNACDGNPDGGKGGNARCNRYGEVGHKMVRCPEQVCIV